MNRATSTDAQKTTIPCLWIGDGWAMSLPTREREWLWELWRPCDCCGRPIQGSYFVQRGVPRQKLKRPLIGSEPSAN